MSAKGEDLRLVIPPELLKGALDLEVTNCNLIAKREIYNWRGERATAALYRSGFSRRLFQVIITHSTGEIAINYLHGQDYRDADRLANRVEIERLLRPCDMWRN